MVDFDALKDEQRKLAAEVVLKDSFKKVGTIAGIDSSYVGDDIISCVVVCNYKTLEVIEKQIAVVKSDVPYKPGFLAYREMPAMVEAYNTLEHVPDVIFVDGHGVAHPRGIGLASHFGLVVNKPTIGVVKSLLIGKIRDGNKVYIGKDLVGIELITREHAKPIYVSPGHHISVGTALRLVKDTIKHPHKLPEPLHVAHRWARKEMKDRAEKS